MSYPEIKNVLSMLLNILLLAAYGIYVSWKIQSGMADPGDIKFWAVTMLIFIGIEIGVQIAVQIAFHILLSAGIAISRKIRAGRCDEKEIEKEIEQELIEDERDKLIELKSMRIAFSLFGAAFVTALIMLVFDEPLAVMINILFVSLYAGPIAAGVLKLYYYRRGVGNGKSI